jgi:nitrogenase molybdenum-iron protein alpha/beta subunit
LKKEIKFKKLCKEIEKSLAEQQDLLNKCCIKFIKYLDNNVTQEEIEEFNKELNITLPKNSEELTSKMQKALDLKAYLG